MIAPSPEIPESFAVGSFTLTRVGPDDVPDLERHFADPNVTEHLDVGPVRSVAEVEAIVEWASGLYEIRRGVRWVLREDGAFVGTCGFNRIEFGSRPHGEIAYDLARSRWGQGVLQTVLPRVLEIGFDEVGVHRIQAFVSPENERSTRVLERLGFQKEGLLRQYGSWRDRLWDVNIHALLRDEWART